MKKNLKAFGRMIDVRQILIAPPMRLLGYLIYLISPFPDQTHIPYKNSINIIIHNALPHFFVKIANILLDLIQMFSFILITALKRIFKRKILDFKSVSIFAIFIVFISIFSLNANYLQFLKSTYNEDWFFCDTGYDSIDDILNLSIYNVYQVPSDDLITFSAPTKNIFINPYDLTFKVSTRAPPE